MKSSFIKSALLGLMLIFTGCSIEGVITDSKGEALENAKIVASYNDEVVEVFSDKNGEYSIDNLDDGMEVSLEVSKEGYKNQSTTLKVVSSGTYEDFSLEALKLTYVHVKGCALDSSAKPLGQRMYASFDGLKSEGIGIDNVWLKNLYSIPQDTNGSFNIEVKVDDTLHTLTAQDAYGYTKTIEFYTNAGDLDFGNECLQVEADSTRNLSVSIYMQEVSEKEILLLTKYTRGNASPDFGPHYAKIDDNSGTFTIDENNVYTLELRTKIEGDSASIEAQTITLTIQDQEFILVSDETITSDNVELFTFGIYQGELVLKQDKSEY